MKDRRKKTDTEAMETRDAEATVQQPGEGAEPGQAAGPTGTADAGATSPVNVEAVRRVAELEDRLLRLQADFDNYRKRVVREREDVWRQAYGDIIGELLPVLDHLDLALASAADHQAPAGLTDGFRMVGDQFVAALRKYGLADVGAEGRPFDPAVHEAVAHVPSDAVADNHVLAQTRRGFMLGDRLLRPAQVVVAKGTAPAPSSQATTADAGDAEAGDTDETDTIDSTQGA